MPTTILRILAIASFVLAILDAAAVISPTNDWFAWPTMVTFGLLFWLLSTDKRWPV